MKGLAKPKTRLLQILVKRAGQLTPAKAVLIARSMVFAATNATTTPQPRQQRQEGIKSMANVIAVQEKNTSLKPCPVSPDTARQLHLAAAAILSRLTVIQETRPAENVLPKAVPRGLMPGFHHAVRGILILQMVMPEIRFAENVRPAVRFAPAAIHLSPLLRKNMVGDILNIVVKLSL